MFANRRQKAIQRHLSVLDNIRCFRQRCYSLVNETAHTRRAVQSNPSLSVTQSWLVATLVKLGRLEDAKAAASRLLVLQPLFSAGKFCAAIDMVPALADALTEAWREAGLPA